MVIACALGVVATWLGILLAYDSDYWVPSSQGLPVSFFIVAVTFVLYLLSGLPVVRRRAGRRRRLGRPVHGRGRRARRHGAPDLMFSGFMVNAWEVATIVAVVAGVVGFFVVLRGAAFPAHAIPNGAFAGAAGASLDRHQPTGRARRLLAGRGPRHRVTRPAGQGRRGHRPGAGDDAGPRCRLPQPEHRVRAPDLLAPLRRDPRRQLGELLPVAAPRCACASRPSPSSTAGCMLTSIVPEIAAAAGLRAPPHRDGVPGGGGLRHHHDGARWSARCLSSA